MKKIKNLEVLEASDFNRQKTLGEGAFSQVWVAERKKDGVQLALKVFTISDQDTVLHEAKAMLKVKSPYLVNLHGICLTEPAFIAMDYLEGGDLSQYLIGSRKSKVEISPLQKLQWARQISHGLYDLHSASVLHRDLKGKNILLTLNHQEAKIGDFGFATSPDLEEEHSTDGPCGTKLWMAPELHKGQANTQESDVFSLSIVLWEIVSQRIPYRSLKEDSQETNLPLKDSYPSVFRQIIRACWASDPKARPNAEQVTRTFSIAIESATSLPQPLSTEKKGEFSTSLDDDSEDDPIIVLEDAHPRAILFDSKPSLKDKSASMSARMKKERAQSREELAEFTPSTEAESGAVVMEKARAQSRENLAEFTSSTQSDQKSEETLAAEDKAAQIRSAEELDKMGENSGQLDGGISPNTIVRIGDAQSDSLRNLNLMAEQVAAATIDTTPPSTENPGKLDKPAGISPDTIQRFGDAQSDSAHNLMGMVTGDPLDEAKPSSTENSGISAGTIQRFVAAQFDSFRNLLEDQVTGATLDKTLPSSPENSGISAATFRQFFAAQSDSLRNLMEGQVTGATLDKSKPSTDAKSGKPAGITTETIRRFFAAQSDSLLNLMGMKATSTTLDTAKPSTDAKSDKPAGITTETIQRFYAAQSESVLNLMEMQDTSAPTKASVAPHRAEPEIPAPAQKIEDTDIFFAKKDLFSILHKELKNQVHDALKEYIKAMENRTGLDYFLHTNPEMQMAYHLYNKINQCNDFAANVRNLHEFLRSSEHVRDISFSTHLLRKLLSSPSGLIKLISEGVTLNKAEISPLSLSQKLGWRNIMRFPKERLAILNNTVSSLIELRTKISENDPNLAVVGMNLLARSAQNNNVASNQPGSRISSKTLPARLGNLARNAGPAIAAATVTAIAYKTGHHHIVANVGAAATVLAAGIGSKGLVRSASSFFHRRKSSEPLAEPKFQSSEKIDSNSTP